MSSREPVGEVSPLEEYRSRLEGGTDPDSPLAQYFQEREPFLQRAAGWLGPRIAVGEKVTQYLNNPLKFLLTAPEEDKALVGAASAAAIGYTGQSLANLLNAPGDYAGADLPVLTTTANFLARSAQGIYTRSEEAAIKAGLREEDIAAAHDVGNFIGFTAPLIASVGAANIVFRAPMLTGISNPIARNFATDFTAGLIYGGLFREGDRNERFSHMLEESAMFGVTSAILGPFTALRAFRLKRARDIQISTEIEDWIRKRELGEEVVIRTPLEVAGVIQLLNQETFLSNSAGAQRLLQLGAQDEALISGIMQMAGTRANSGIMRNFAAGDFFEVQKRLDRFRDQFPNVKFDIVKREVSETIERPIEIVTGPAYQMDNQVYSGKIDQLHSDIIPPGVDPLTIPSEAAGFSTNLRPFVSRTEAGEIAHKAKQPMIGTEKGKRGSGRPHAADFALAPNRGIDQPLSTETVTITRPEYDIYFGSRGLSNKQRAQLKKEGRFAGQIVTRGSNQMEYIGLSKKKGYSQVRRADGKVLNVKTESLTDTPFISELVDRTPRLDGMYQAFREFLETADAEVVASRGGLTERDLLIAIREGTIQLQDDARRAFDASGSIMYPEQLGITAENMINKVVFGESPTQPIAELVRAADGSWTLTGTIPGTLQPMSFSTIEEAMQRLEGMPVADVVTKLTTAQEAMEALLRGGTEEAGLLSPMPVYNFEQMFDAWATRAGLPTDAADYLTTRHFFSQQMRRDMWAALPEEEQVIFNNLIREQEELLAAADVPIAALGRSRGFHAEELSDGRWRLSEVNTGFQMDFGSEELARSALRKIVRNEKDMMGVTPEFLHSLGEFSQGGFQNIMDVTHIPDDILSAQTQQLLPWTFFRNRRDYFIQIEQETGIPIWSQGYQRVLEGHDRQLAELQPWAKAIHDTWRGIKTPRRNELAKLWASIEGEGLDNASAIRRFKDAGFTPLEINAFTRSRAMMDIWFQQSGIDPKRYIDNYYSRIRPSFEKRGYVDPKDLKPYMAEPEYQFWAEMSRTGELASVELDPEIVLHKYIRGMLFNKHVAEPWGQLAHLVGTKDGRISPLKISDLPAEKAASILRRSMDRNPDSPVIPDEIRGITAEFLNALRGTADVSVHNLRTYSQRWFRKLGVQVDERVGEELMNNFISSMYGSAMGLRPATVARNIQQNTWMLYTRIGNKQMGRGLEVALSQEGYNEAFDEGVLRLAEAGVFYGDRVFSSLLENAPPVGVDGASSRVVASVLKRALRAGRMSREVAQKFMVPFSNSDQVSRAWAYHAQKLHTADWLDRFESGKISWDKFTEEGLPFFATPIKENFLREYNRYGRERALRFIGRMGSDEANFIYGVGSQPGWMQSVPGRLAGMFGQWPMWAIELYAHRVKYATRKQKAMLYLRTAALMGAYGNMAMESGSNMWSWIAPASPLTWGGGPAVQFGIDLALLMSAPFDQKAAAIGRLASDIGRISLPGQGFWRDMTKVLNANNPQQALFAVMLGSPTDKGHFALDALYTTELESPQLDQERLDALPSVGSFNLPDPRRGMVGAMDADSTDLPGLGESMRTTSTRREDSPPLYQLLGNIR